MEAYALLKLTWWVLLGVLLSGLAIMVGMDMGVGTILRYVARTDDERRIVLNVIGPHWDGNQVWFILGGGAIFAAWPTIYATAFCGLYVVMLILLWSMIVRPLGLRIQEQAALRQMAQSLGLEPFCQRFYPHACLRGGHGQHASGGALPFRLEHAVPLHRQFPFPL